MGLVRLEGTGIASCFVAAERYDRAHFENPLYWVIFPEKPTTPNNDLQPFRELLILKPWYPAPDLLGTPNPTLNPQP